MKKIFSVLLIVASTSAFAAEVSEFERGYQAGLRSCAPTAPQTELYLCSGGAIYQGSSTCEAVAETGWTRVEALSKIPAFQISARQHGGPCSSQPIFCVKL